MNNLTLGFIGLGLIGGSIAKGFKRADQNHHIMAYARHRSTLDAALRDGTIDEALDGVDENLSRCDYIFLCTPVSYNEEYLTAIRPYLRKDAILTDVGSVKTNIHEAVEKMGLEANFIGGHPMAGSEKSGYQYSTDHLVENAYYVITPTPFSPPEKVEELRRLALSLSALPLILDYRQHDYIVAGISHLPHLIASSLVNLVKDKDTPEQTMKLVAAGGFKDITRIASSSPVMWQQICATNRENIQAILGDYIASLEQVRTAVAGGDDEAVYDLFDTSREYRNSIPDRSSGPIKKEYSLYCDIVDESGAIATIATILAAHQISIKNIGIIHNREFEEGVLKIEFYEEDASLRAVDLLTQCRYTVYHR
ncbi:prephenate dehydrogenase [Qiania dongpingensis]|uniref:Prephenate dehydrogenase n=1 Tax=Qiania dongpingensis TaxID=2763669 RepID=A0A7G9G3Y4_9FIRM|nr:prephenate dehydrogenase [Qiania dongpingensis]QNM05516.1 prephenate dehydrogenase [Qiania dongpingensis]